MEHPRVVADRETLRQVLRAVRAEGRTIGLVPTMGALHEGHLSLVRRSVQECDFTVVTIFVNPTQFGPHEDFCATHGRWSPISQRVRERTDLVFAPAADDIYRDRFSTFVDPPAVSLPLEGNCRPGHFRGVATIVLKLFQLVPADVAYFGQKDYQQTRVIQDMTRDLDVPMRIEVCPIIRERDGLAMSSRNRYLSATERGQSLALCHSLQRATELVRQGQHDAAAILHEMRSILAAAGIARVDYVALVDPVSLADVDQVDEGTMALVAAYVGDTRLIDNGRIG